MTAAERIVDALRSHDRAPRQSGAGWSARCPAHADRDPSLSLRQGAQGALMYCQAGCQTTDVMAAIGLTMADLFDDRKGAEYRYADGRVVHRTPDKKFPQSGNKNGRPTLYHLPEVVAAVRDGRPVFLVEGEKDADAVRLLGATATTAPMGAANFRKVDAAPLAGAHVVVIPDRDPAGERWLRDVLATLTGNAASLRLAHALVGKDAADHIAAGHDLAALVESPLPKVPPPAASGPTLPGDPPDLGWHYGAGGPPADAEPAEWWTEIAGRYTLINWYDLWAHTPDEIEWLCEPLLARGRSIALYSPAKAGKSLLALEIAAALACGRSVIGNPAREPLRVLYVDLENTPEDLRDRLSALGYGPADLGNLAYLSFPNLPALDSPDGGRHLLACALKHRADLVIIDTVARVIDGDENEANTFNALYRHALVHLKGRKIAVMRLDHSGKDMDRGQRGSSAKSSDVDAVWLLVKATERTLYLSRQASRSPDGADRVDLRREFSPLRHVVTTAAASLPAEIQELCDALDRLGVPLDHGRDRAKRVLVAAGIECRNAALSGAIKARQAPENLSPNLSPRSTQETCPQTCPEPVPAIKDSAGQTCPGQVGDRYPQVSATDLSPSPPPMGGTGSGEPSPGQTPKPSGIGPYSPATPGRAGHDRPHRAAQRGSERPARQPRPGRPREATGLVSPRSAR